MKTIAITSMIVLNAITFNAFSNNNTLNISTEITNQNPDEIKKELVEMYIATGDFKNAKELLSELEASPFTEFYSIMITLREDNRTYKQLSTDELEVLKSLVTTDNEVALKAQGLLNAFSGSYSERAVVTPFGNVEENTAKKQAEEQAKVANDIEVYPNPAIDFAHINHAFNNEGSIEIYDMNGKLIDAKSVNALTKQVTLNFNNYVNGVYVCVVTDGTERFQKRLVIQK